ncbi:hypothetical protein TNCV_3147281 [Trichonephila clavipes]|nr:hypothetical protein TNCV_3147281 [Trichonephila clavipes]
MHSRPTSTLRIKLLKEKYGVLQCIPGPCGVTGNEQAYFLAKGAPDCYSQVVYHSIKLITSSVAKSPRVAAHSETLMFTHSIKLYIKQTMTRYYKLQLLDRIHAKRWESENFLTILNCLHLKAGAKFRLLRLRQPGVWLLLAVDYGMFGAILRIFEGRLQFFKEEDGGPSNRADGGKNSLVWDHEGF